jgi:IS30 family transposase
LKKVYLRLVYAHKHKKTAYDRFSERYEKMLNFMVREQIIPYLQAIIHSRVHEKYWRRRRKWEFNRVFFLCGEEKDVETSVEKLKRTFHIELVSSSTLTNYLNEKVMALEAFNMAKAEL